MSEVRDHQSDLRIIHPHGLCLDNECAIARTELRPDVRNNLCDSISRRGDSWSSANLSAMISLKPSGKV